MCEQTHGFEQQIVEIERVGLPQGLFVLFVNHGQLRHSRIGGRARKDPAAIPSRS